MKHCPECNSTALLSLRSQGLKICNGCGARIPWAQGAWVIYSTSFNANTKEVTGRSAKSGFASLADVEAFMGAPDQRFSRYLVYGTGEERVAYSDFVFSIDGTVSTD